MNTSTKTIATKIEPSQQSQQTTTQRTLVLRLQQKPLPRVSWTSETIDNQHMNKKKSNLCCIYHRPGESSSDTCTSDDEGNALERDRHTKHLHKKVCSKRKNKQNQLKKDPSSKAPNQSGKKFLED